MDQVNEDKNIGDEVVDRETEQGFTSGEWKASGNGVHVGTRCVAIAFDPHGRNVETAVANARLIAAAPALYAAAKTLDALDWIIGYELTEANTRILDRALDTARTALALTVKAS